MAKVSNGRAKTPKAKAPKTKTPKAGATKTSVVALGGPAAHTRMGISAEARRIGAKKPLHIDDLATRISEKLGIPLARVRSAVGGHVYGNENWKKTDKATFQFVGK